MSRVQTAEDVENDSAWQEANPQTPSAKESLRERWYARDTVDELVDELLSVGRTKEAELIDAILTRGDTGTEEHDIRGYVSSLWAEDWNSDEDAAYDRV